jgi:hypothetical protein
VAIATLRPQVDVVLAEYEEPPTDSDENGSVGDAADLALAVARWENEGGAVVSVPAPSASRFVADQSSMQLP